MSSSEEELELDDEEDPSLSELDEDEVPLLLLLEEADFFFFFFWTGFAGGLPLFLGLSPGWGFLGAPFFFLSAEELDEEEDEPFLSVFLFLFLSDPLDEDDREFCFLPFPTPCFFLPLP